MSCFHPIYRRPPSLFEQQKYGNRWIAISDYDWYKEHPSIDNVSGEVLAAVPTACGKCVACRLDYSRRWATRICLESLEYDKGLCWFITLTYAPEHVHSNKFGVLTLYPKDVTDFLKRLRITYERKFDHTGIRYFYCGEYGDKTARPHYHMCAFNLPIFDKTYFYSNFRGDMFYLSSMIEGIWSLGQVTVSALNWQTAAYTARYVMKKLKGKGAKEAYEEADLVAPYVRMSRMPGIASRYFDEHCDLIYLNDNIVLPGGKVERPPKYFDNKLKEIDPIQLVKLKLKRSELAEFTRQYECKQHNYPEEQYFAIKEAQFKERAKKLVRALD